MLLIKPFSEVLSKEEECEWDLETSAPRMSLGTGVSGNLRVRCHKSSSLPSLSVLLQLPAASCCCCCCCHCSEALDCTSLRPVTHRQIYRLQSPKFTRPAGPRWLSLFSALHNKLLCSSQLPAAAYRAVVNSHEAESKYRQRAHAAKHSPACQSVYVTVMCSWVLRALPQDGAEWQQSIRVINM